MKSAVPLIHETIVTTVDPSGAVHIAPMGVREQDGLIVIAPFRPSRTLENMRRTRAAVLNYTDDVRVFAGCLTGRADWPTRPADIVAGRILEQALAHRELGVTSFEDDALRPRFICREVHGTTYGPFRGFNRAQGAVIEAAILASRLDMLPADKVQREIDYLRIAVEKTAGLREREAWSWLLEKIAATGIPVV